MLNISRRGPASISSILRTATSASSRICSARSALVSTTQRCSTIQPLLARTFALSTHLRGPAAATAVKQESFDAEESQHKTVNTFEDLKTFGLADDVIVNTIAKEMKINDMTDVQKGTINKALDGTDM